MKSVIEIDTDTRTVTVSFVMEKMDDVGHAINIVTDAGEMVWPDLVVEDVEPGAAVEDGLEAGDEEEAEAAKSYHRWTSSTDLLPRRKRKPLDYSKPPKPGSVYARVLDAAQRLGTTDTTAIADDLDLLTHVAAVAVANLRRGGHLT